MANTLSDIIEALEKALPAIKAWHGKWRFSPWHIEEAEAAVRMDGRGILASCPSDALAEYIALLSPENIRLLLDAIKREPVKVKALSDDQIMEVIKECFPWQSEPKINDLLTHEKSPPLFPQATYDVPSYRATNFVRAIERRILSSLQPASSPPATEAIPEGWRTMESAPKDGTHFLWCSDDGNQHVIFWPNFHECFKEGHWRPLGPEPYVQVPE